MKRLVSESLNEYIRFERGVDPRTSMGIGVIEKYGLRPEEKRMVIDLWKVVDMDKGREDAIDAIDQNWAAGICSIRIFSNLRGGLRYFKGLFRESGFDKYLDPDLKSHIHKLKWQGEYHKEAYFKVDPKYYDIFKNIMKNGLRFGDEYSRSPAFLYPLYQ